jgi:hypothetical protein
MIAIKTVIVLVLVSLGIAPRGCLSEHIPIKEIKQNRLEIPAMKQQLIEQYGKNTVVFPNSVAMDEEVHHLFPVPRKNSVGTNDLDNAITFLELGDESVRRHIIARDFLEEVSGDYKFGFTPVFSQDEIVYTQTRGMVCINAKTGKANLYDLCGIQEQIGGIAVIDPAKKLFVTELLRPLAPDYERFLQVIQPVTEDSVKVIGEVAAGMKKFDYGSPWFVYQGKLFVCDDSVPTIKCFDATLTPATHILTETFKKENWRLLGISEIDVHPTMPFALLLARGKDPALSESRSDLSPQEKKAVIESLAKAGPFLWILRWDIADPQKQLVPLVTHKTSLLPGIQAEGSKYDSEKFVQISSFDFSPDGRWLVYRDNSRLNNTPGSNPEIAGPDFVAVPIDKKYPYFLGKPIILGPVLRKYEKPVATAWATDPTTFVVSDGQVLYWWNLEKLPRG